MSWFSVTRSVLYYVFLPLTTLLNILLVLLAPLMHLTFYTAHGFLLPFSFLGKFESLYIFFGVAALIGLITGSFLHLSSLMLTSLFNLSPTIEEVDSGRTASSVRAARERKRLERAWESSGGAAWTGPGMEQRAEEMKMEYAEFLEKDRGKKKGGQGLFAQTILEEDDDSEVEF